MKTHSKNQQVTNASVQAKAKKQAQEASILQAYKDSTAQLAAAEEEAVQGKFETAQLAEEDEELT